MKHIKLKISSTNKNKKVLNVINKFNIKFINNYYVIEDKLFNELKKEINSLDIDLSIIRNPDYVYNKRENGKNTTTN